MSKQFNLDVDMKFLIFCLVFGVLFPLYGLADEAPAEPLFVEGIECEGNTATDCSFISSNLYLSPGDLVNEEEIHSARLRLSSLTNFKAVDIFLKKGSEKGKALVVIQVEESSPYTSQISLGLWDYSGVLSQKIGARVSHQNLFGQGKILDFEINEQVPVRNARINLFSTRLQYIDPHLYGSKKYFMVAGVTYENQMYSFDLPSRDKSVSADISFGRRFGDFSYVSVGFKYLDEQSEGTSYADFFNTTETKPYNYYTYSHFYRASYGWNSEDDVYFPTQGSSFDSSLSWSRRGWSNYDDSYTDFYELGIGYRTTWVNDNNTIWTFKVGSPPYDSYRRTSFEEGHLLALTYARSLDSQFAGGIERGRWYVEPSWDWLTSTSLHGIVSGVSLKGGLRFENKAIGLIDLYLLASTDGRR